MLENSFGNGVLESLNELDFRILAKKEVEGEFEKTKQKILHGYDLDKRVLSIVVEEEVVRIPIEVRLNLNDSSNVFFYDVDFLKKRDDIKVAELELRDYESASNFLLK